MKLNSCDPLDAANGDGQMHFAMRTAAADAVQHLLDRRSLAIELSEVPDEEREFVDAARPETLRPVFRRIVSHRVGRVLTSPSECSLRV